MGKKTIRLSKWGIQLCSELQWKKYFYTLLELVHINTTLLESILAIISKCPNIYTLWDLEIPLLGNYSKNFIWNIDKCQILSSYVHLGHLWIIKTICFGLRKTHNGAISPSNSGDRERTSLWSRVKKQSRFYVLGHHDTV